MAEFYVDNVGGSATGTGTSSDPVLTGPQALALPTTDTITNIYFKGTGTPYTDPINVIYYRGVNLRKWDGFAKPIYRAVTSASLIQGQDHCLLGISDFKLDYAASGAGAILVSLRQLTIFDGVNIDWGGGAFGNTFIFAYESAQRLQLTGSHSVNGSANSFLTASDASLDGTVDVLMSAAGYSFPSGFFNGSKGAMLDASGWFFSGPGGNVQTSGYQAVLSSGARLWRPTRYGGVYPIPGNQGISAVPNDSHVY